MKGTKKKLDEEMLQKELQEHEEAEKLQDELEAQEAKLEVQAAKLEAQKKKLQEKRDKNASELKKFNFF